MKVIYYLLFISILFSCSKDTNEIKLNGSVTNFVTGQKISGIQLKLFKRLKHSSVSIVDETVETIITDGNGEFDVSFMYSDKYEYSLRITDWRYFGAGYICPGAISAYSVSNYPSQTVELRTAAKAWIRLNFNILSSSINKDSLYVNFFDPDSNPYTPFICFISDSSEYANYMNMSIIEGNQYAEFNFIKNGIDSTFSKFCPLTLGDTTVVEIELY